MKKIQEILVLHHCHTDIGFTHPQPVVWELQNRFIDRALDLLDETAGWPEHSRPRWTCEATAPVLHWLDSAGRRDIERFRRHAASGRLGIGAMFCHFTPLCNADELARSLQPVRELRRLLGAPIKAAIVHDVNGLPWPAAQLLLDAGVEMLLMGINVHFGGFPLTRPLAFKWGTSDGRDLLTFNGEHYQGFDRVFRLSERSLDAMAAGFADYEARLQAAGYPYDFAFLTATHHTCADNNPPNFGTASMIRDWNEQGHGPAIRYVTPEMLLQRLQGLESVARFSGAWDDYWSFGVGNAARETRMSRHTRTRLESAGLLAASVGKSGGRSQKRALEAWRDVMLFDEHTFGSCMAVEHPEFDDSASQWQLKAACAGRARGLTTILLRDQLESLASNPVEGNGIEGVLAVNPSPVARRVFPRVPSSWLEKKWDHILSNVPLVELLREKWEAGEGILCGPVELPPYSYKVYPVSELSPASGEAGLSHGPGFIESPFFRLDFDPGSGRITGLLDKATGGQIVDTESPWPFFGLVQETIAGGGARDAFHEFDWDKIPAGTCCWRPDWPPLRRGPGGPPAISTSISPDGVTLVQRWESAPGVENLEQRWKLPAHRAAVEMTAAFHKSDISHPEALYFALPLNLPGWRAHYETANLPAEFDSGQLPGSCRDYTTAGQWIALHNEALCVTIACPDAPLFQIGGFHFAKVGQSVERTSGPLLLAWPMNNYWNVNFRSPNQPGPVSFRYELTTSRAFDPAASTEAGLDAAVPVEFHPVVHSRRRKEGRLIELDGRGIFLLGLRAAAEGGGVIAVVANVADQPREGTIRFGRRKLSAAWISGTLEEPREAAQVVDGAAALSLPPQSVRTIRLEFQ